MGMGGSSSSQQDALIQSTAPFASLGAGQIGAQAAGQASALYEEQINNAINSLNQNYLSAITALQPASQSGVQALDQLNQYLGLNAYTPAQAPTKPTNPLGNPIMGTGPDGQTGVVGYSNDKLQSLYGMALGIANATGQGTANSKSGIQTLAAQDQAHLITSMATQLANIPEGFTISGKGKNQTVTPSITPTEQSFLNMYYSMGGTPGQTGGAFLQQYADQLNPNYQTQLQNYNLQQANYNQDVNWANQYNTPLTQDQITQQVENQPGYQSQLSQGIDAIDKSASAKGYLGSGALLKELSNFGQNTFSDYYNNMLNRLGSEASAGQQAATSIAGLNSQQGSSLASLYQSLGDTQANSSLAAGNSLAQALIAANQQYWTMPIGSSSSSSGMDLGGIGSLVGSLGSAFSSKDLKDTFKPVSTKDILEKVDQLNVEQWRYKNIPVDRIGPYAQEFKDLFGVGDGQTINLIDVCGILLASVKELSKKVEELKNGN